MALYLISYDLTKSESHYSKLMIRLQEFGAERVLKSEWVYVAESTISVSDVYEDLIGFLHEDDSLLVAELKSNAAWNRLQISDDQIHSLLLNAGN